MSVKDLLNSKVGKFVISVLLGIGLSCLFYKTCKTKNCIHFKGPVINDIENKIFQYDDKCYTYKLKAVQCDKSKQIVNFV
jgi:hypothetical protein